MQNRFATIALITLVSLFGGMILFVIGLFMFPGISLFGIRYVSLNGRAVQTGKVALNDKVDNFSGIIINAHEVPVYVYFTSERDYEFEFLDNFNGLTKSKNEYPTIEFKKDDKGNAVINVTEFTTFIYRSGTSQRYIKLYVPLQDVVDEKPFVRDITINSAKSNISFEKESGESRIPRLNKVALNTNGKVSYNSLIKANTFEYETNNSIVIPNVSENCVDATNYTLTSTAGSITINKNSVGVLNLKTNQGDIKLRNCSYLTATTNYGDIDYAFLEDEEKEGKSVLVNGTAKITSKSGNVNIGTINGGAESEIITTSGKVTIDKMLNGKIKTSRGSVKIKTSKNLEISSTNGKVYVEEASENLKVETARSNIYLGGENKKMNNVKVFSRIGKVYMYSASGTADIETLSSDVEFNNLTSDDITIKCGGKLKATELRGLVEISSQKNVNLTFADLSTNNVTISLGDGCTSAVIEALNNKKDDVNYYIAGAKVLIKEYQNNTQVTLKDTNDYKVSNGQTTVQFKVTSKNATIDICFKNSSETVA